MEENKKSECDPNKHNFIPLFETNNQGTNYIGALCACCGKRISGEDNENKT